MTHWRAPWNAEKIVRYDGAHVVTGVSDETAKAIFQPLRMELYDLDGKYAGTLEDTSRAGQSAFGPIDPPTFLERLSVYDWQDAIVAVGMGVAMTGLGVMCLVIAYRMATQ